MQRYNNRKREKNNNDGKVINVHTVRHSGCVTADHSHHSQYFHSERKRKIELCDKDTRRSSFATHCLIAALPAPTMSIAYNFG